MHNSMIPEKLEILFNVEDHIYVLKYMHVSTGSGSTMYEVHSCSCQIIDLTLI